MPPGRLLKIEISDFLSFQGIIVIELVDNCRWLTILEGGQSNFIDAILFALGGLPNDSSHSLESFTYKDENGHRDPRSETYVALKIKADDGTDKVFKRSIENKQSEYCLDNKLVSRKTYFDSLKKEFKTEQNSILINRKIIDSIVNQTSEERTLIFEEICGSIRYKTKYDRLKKELNSEESEEESLKTTLNTVKTKVDHLKKSVVKIKELEESLDKSTTEYYSFVVHYLNEDCIMMEQKAAEVWTTVVNEIVIKLEECIEKLAPFKKISPDDDDDTNKNNEISISKISRPSLSSELSKCIDIPSVKEDQMKLDRKLGEVITLFKSINGVTNVRVNKKLQFDIDKNKLDKNNDAKKQIEILRQMGLQFNTCIDEASKEWKKTLQMNIHEQEKLFQSATNNGVWKTSVKIVKRDANDCKNDDEDHNFSYDRNKKNNYKLPDNLLDITDEKKRKITKDVLCKKMKNLLDELDVMKGIQREIDTINNEINYLENKIKKISINSSIRRKFNFIKNNRIQCFMNFFCQLAIDVNEIYSMLSDGEDNNSVKFICENPEEPYLGEIQIEYTDELINSLDEKNKSLAGLALLFGLSKINHLPFLLLDNIDDQLDDKQFLCLMNYLMQLKTNQQIVLIKKSFHDKIYECADIVIFIGKDTEDDNVNEKKFFLIKS
ncbi:hypothetical protein HCN44_001185 [Aphidius gifuensis]|uniref:RecF/RecN/SMC N-terminal domain-containing protein n=2 Tax=Aphidius gifuensis TaxID=684658 RepID=A0A834XN77_APHGI|nr:hypothetical protein HCN44_001185 [Aphidius gifuensis]